VDILAYRSSVVCWRQNPALVAGFFETYSAATSVVVRNAIINEMGWFCHRVIRVSPLVHREPPLDDPRNVCRTDGRVLAGTRGGPNIAGAGGVLARCEPADHPGPQHAVPGEHAEGTPALARACHRRQEPPRAQVGNLLIVLPRHYSAELRFSSIFGWGGRGGDLAYILPMLGGLSKAEIEELLPALIEGDKIEERIIRRMIGRYDKPLMNPRTSARR
jgi:hypothetical protein